jgi:hypothetical protein
MVWLGLISFSFYLWHWPILSLGRIIEDKTPASGIRLASILFALLLSWLTYQWIEHPMRFGKSGRLKVGLLSGAMLLLAAVGLAIYVNGGFEQRIPETSRHLASDFAYSKHWEGWFKCKDSPNNCRIMDPDNDPDIEIIGDSHAGHLASGLKWFFRDTNHNIEIRLSAGCMPFFQIQKHGNTYYSCDGDAIGKSLEQAISSNSVKTIVLSGYANLSILGNRASTSNDSNPKADLDKSSTFVIQQKAEIFQRAMYLTLSRLVQSDKQIIFLVDIPELDFDPRECVRVRPVVLPGYETRAECVVPRSAFDARNEKYHKIVAEAKLTFPSVRFIETYSYFCDHSHCRAMIDGEILYASSDHLSPAGSRYLLRNIAQQLL